MKNNLLNLIRRKCAVNNAQSFAGYIEVLKLIRNAGVRNLDIIRSAYYAYFKFVVKPELFIINLPELFEVDALHQQLDEQYNFKFNPMIISR